MESIAKHSFVTVISCILESVTIQQDNVAYLCFVNTSSLRLPQSHRLLRCVNRKFQFVITLSGTDFWKELLARILKYSNCSIECLVLALIYIDRLIQSGSIPVNSLTIHRILITRLVLCFYVICIVFWSLSNFSMILSVQTVTTLE